MVGPLIYLRFCLKYTPFKKKLVGRLVVKQLLICILFAIGSYIMINDWNVSASTNGSINDTAAWVLFIFLLIVFLARSYLVLDRFKNNQAQRAQRICQGSPLLRQMIGCFRKDLKVVPVEGDVEDGTGCKPPEAAWQDFPAGLEGDTDAEQRSPLRVLNAQVAPLPAAWEGSVTAFSRRFLGRDEVVHPAAAGGRPTDIGYLMRPD